MLIKCGFVCLCLSVCLFVCVSVCLSVCFFLYICECVLIGLCVSVYIYECLWVTVYYLRNRPSFQLRMSLKNTMCPCVCVSVFFCKSVSVCVSLCLSVDIFVYFYRNRPRLQRRMSFTNNMGILHQQSQWWNSGWLNFVFVAQAPVTSKFLDAKFETRFNCIFLQSEQSKIFTIYFWPGVYWKCNKLVVAKSISQGSV